MRFLIIHFKNNRLHFNQKKRSRKSWKRNR